MTLSISLGEVKTLQQKFTELAAVGMRIGTRPPGALLDAFLKSPTEHADFHRLTALNLVTLITQVYIEGGGRNSLSTEFSAQQAVVDPSYMRKSDSMPQRDYYNSM